MRLIVHDMPQGWQWVAVDDLGTVIAESDRAFDTRDACVHDAENRGYAEGAVDPIRS